MPSPAHCLIHSLCQHNRQLSLPKYEIIMHLLKPPAYIIPVRKANIETTQYGSDNDSHLSVSQLFPHTVHWSNTERDESCRIVNKVLRLFLIFFLGYDPPLRPEGVWGWIKIFRIALNAIWWNEN